ncbi:hypothetical protein OEZ85_005751 [Tetradesmus obliquus]|uniref:RRM domain-containing protein n=1 Tax=Tetradesmus obliquus TaxID=3088 RepID=A0ABY8UJQ2_TETOB|nr:hypothetical protein OEZ85_005751 [Tetradesmus obliquus]
MPLDEPGAAAPTAAAAAAAAAAATLPSHISSPAARLTAQVPPTVQTSELELLFGGFGKLAEVNLFRAWGSAQQSKGCGLVTCMDWQCAAAAMAQLHRKYVFPGSNCAVVVEWMDPKKLRKLNQHECAGTLAGFLDVSSYLDHGQLGATAPTGAAAAAATLRNPMSRPAAHADRTLLSLQLFFAKVPPAALASELELLFGCFGELAEVNLFRGWPGAKEHKGCGLVTYVDRQCAAAAMAQLHRKYVFPGSDCPIVVEWMDPQKQKKTLPI